MQVLGRPWIDSRWPQPAAKMDRPGQAPSNRFVNRFANRPTALTGTFIMVDRLV